MLESELIMIVEQEEVHLEENYLVTVVKREKPTASERQAKSREKKVKGKRRYR